MIKEGPHGRGIYGFRGKYRWLSNFVDCPIEWEGTTYPSSENAYQAAKTNVLEERKQFLNIKSSEAKKLGTKVTLRDDWEEVKLGQMTAILVKKFRQEPFRSKLIETGDLYIEETNTWGDRYWGVCDGVGENWLGRIIMQIRSGLKSRWL